MAGSDRYLGQGRMPSLLTMASDYEDDAVAVHERARALREKNSGPPSAEMIGEGDPTPAPIEPEWADGAPEAALPASRGVVKAIGLACAGAVLGAAVAFAWPKTYVATSEVLIDPRAAQVSPDAALALVDNQLRILRSGTLLTAVADKLNLASDAEFSGAGGPFAELFGSERGNALEQRRREAVIALGRAVSVERSGTSSVVSVSAASRDPQKSALIANTISDLFVESAGGRVAAGDERLAELKQAVAEAERAIEAFKARNELVDAEGTLITDEEIKRLGEQLSVARARTVELNARTASTRETNVDSIVTGSLPEQFASPSLTELRARHADARQQLDRLSVKLGPRHPERLAAEAEVEATRQEIANELRRVAAALQTELKRAVEQEQQLAAQLAGMKVRQGEIGGDLVELRELERQAETRRFAYEQALRAAQAGAAQPGLAGVISRAEPPLAASGPSLPTFSLMGGLAGLFLGAGLSMRGRRKNGAQPEEDHLQAQQDAEDRQMPDHDSPDMGEDDETMYPYQPYMQPAEMPQQPQPAYSGAPFHPQQPIMPLAPQMTPQQPLSPPVWPYPAPHPQAYAPQMMPHDPWAHLRGWMPPAPPAWQPMTQPVVYVPVPVPSHAPQHQAAAPVPPAAVREPVAEPRHHPLRSRQVEEHWPDQDAFVDERTDAAIEEIRRSLREFRDAIEGFAEDRHVYSQTGRRYGT